LSKEQQQQQLQQQQQQQQPNLSLRCRILLEQGIMFLAASKISSQTSKVGDTLTIVVVMMRLSRDLLLHAIDFFSGIESQRLSH
jgi:hypothetical protein